MASAPEIIVRFLADTTGLAKASSDLQRSTKGAAGGLGKLGKAGLVAGGAAGLAFLAGAVKTGAEELSEAAKVSAQTEAAIKSTGGAANVSAQQVNDLATAMMKKTGMDDEAIQSGENMLLTFTRIRNEAGKGNDVFNQATKAVLDMSTALGQDTTQSAMQLGKALNDPIKGVTALRRVGVALTDAQQKQVKAMVASGDVMGAQKLILRELNTEFGGSAEAIGKTLPGQINVLKQSFSNLAGELLSKLVPAFTAITRFLTEHPALFNALVIAVGALAVAMIALNAALAVTAALEAGILGPALLVVAALVGIAAAAYLLYKNWDTIVAGLTAGWDAIKAAAQAVFDWVSANWPTLLAILTGPFGIAVLAIARHWDEIKSAITSALDAIKSAVTVAWNAIKTVVTTAVGAIETVAVTAWNTIKSTVVGALNAIETTATSVWNAVKSVVATAAAAIQTTVTTIFNAVKSVVNSFHDAVSAVGDAFDAAKSAAQRAGTFLSTTLKKAVEVAKEAIDPLVGAIHSVAAAFDAVSSAIQSMIDWIKKIPSKIDLPSLPHIPGLGAIGLGAPAAPTPSLRRFGIPALAGGGLVTGPTLALLGERGREIVAPENMLRRLIDDRPLEVRVFIGDTELRGLVRAEVRAQDTLTAQTLLAGLV